MKPSRDLSELLAIMAALRTPGTGCPWDLQQTFASIAPYTIEEAYEVADAITRGDLTDLKDELGDLLLQVVFHARMAQEQTAFDFGDVVEAITGKLVRRHPHVFGDARNLSSDDVQSVWMKIKAQEKEQRLARQKQEGVGTQAGALADIPVNLSPLMRALKLQNKAGDVGFDWNDPKAVLAKIHEEADEIAGAIQNGGLEEVKEEIGDLLFAVVNLARHLDVEPDGALRAANFKFERRFASIERALALQGKTPQQATLAEMDALWDAAKAEEKIGRN